jgi:hypothetical protein
MNTVFGLNQSQAQSLVDILQKALALPQVRTIRFEFNKITIDASMYVLVSQALSNGMKAFDPSVNGPGDMKGFNLQVALSPQITDPAQFRQQTNTIMFKPPLPSIGIGFYSIIVHECTHAALDLRKVALSQLNNEIAAYLAEAMFVVASLDGHFKGGKSLAEIEALAVANYGGKGDKIRPAAIHAAVAVLKQRKRFHYDDVYVFYGTDALVEKLGEMIKTDPNYANPLQGNAMNPGAMVNWYN